MNIFAVVITTIDDDDSGVVVVKGIVGDNAGGVGVVGDER